MSAPLVVGAVCARPECGHGEDLHDGICFGTACECVRFVAAAGVLPVPVGPEPQVDPVTAGRRLDLLALMDERAASVVSPVLAAVLDEVERLRKERDAFRDQRNAVFATNARLLAEVQESDQARLTAENETRTVRREADVLRARVAELEAERHTTNEALHDAVRALWAARPGEDDCPCPPAGRPHQVGCPLDGVPPSGVGPDSPEMRSLREALTGSPDRQGREPEGEFDSFLRHPYRTGHDLPETGGAQ